MKIIAQQLLEYFKNKPKVSELSERLFQLGHEHELNKGIFDFEITPNRGDCLSLKGLARDLNYFYKAEIEKPIFTKKIQKLNLNFKNKTKLVTSTTNTTASSLTISSPSSARTFSSDINFAEDSIICFSINFLSSIRLGNLKLFRICLQNILYLPFLQFF